MPTATQVRNGRERAVPSCNRARSLPSASKTLLSCADALAAAKAICQLPEICANVFMRASSATHHRQNAWREYEPVGGWRAPPGRRASALFAPNLDSCAPTRLRHPRRMEEAIPRAESAATNFDLEDAVYVRVLEAALGGDLAAIKRAIEEDGVNVDQPDDDGACNSHGRATEFVEQCCTRFLSPPRPCCARGHPSRFLSTPRPQARA